MNPAPPALPEIDGEACVHALAPYASCRACVEACPAGALVLDDDSLGIETARCTACGLCVPACPRGAIALARPVESVEGRPHRQAFAACSRTAGSLPGPACLQALGARDLDALAEAGVAQLMVTSADCRGCVTGADPLALGRAAEAHRIIRHSRGQPAVTLAWRDLAAFRRARSRALEAAGSVDQARRRLLRVMERPLPEAPPQGAPVAAISPVIDAAVCTGCDACARICPDGALRLERQGAPRYAVDPVHCTGCRLCIDVCESRAIRLVPLGPGAPASVPLSAFRCRACGVPGHRPSAAGSASADLCRICAVTGHHSKLFQVFDAS